jgi:mannosylglycerate hydrolase MGH1-like protein
MMRTPLLPQWGPYSKRLAGISHIPAAESGIRFDLSVFPGYYRGPVNVPDARWASGWHPWEASADLRYYTLRHELEWKDQVYADISYCEIDGNSRLIRCDYVNATDIPQSLCLHLFAGLAFPQVKPETDIVLDDVQIDLPPKHAFVRAADYDTLEFAKPRPTDSLVADALKRGEMLGLGFVDGSGVGCGFGATGDRLCVTVRVKESFFDARLLVRFRAGDAKGGPVTAGDRTLRLEGLVSAEISTSDRDLDLVSVEVGALAPGEHTVTVIGTGSGPVEIDSFTIVEAAQVDAVRFRSRHFSDQPIISGGADGACLELHYPELDRYDPDLRYCIGWDSDRAVVREFLTDHLDELIRRSSLNHVRTRITERWNDTEEGAQFTNVFIRPIMLTPGERRVIWSWVSVGPASTAREVVRGIAGASAAERESIYQANRATRVLRAGSAEVPNTDKPADATLGQELMAATTLMNVVYPVRRCGQSVIHNTPGRWWNSLYTWDSGFIGLGLLELDKERAVDCLRMYLTSPDDDHRAFIHHGTPLPVQIYLMQEIWNREPDPELLSELYPGLQRFYEFLAGRLGSSTTDPFESDLLTTWDYFYNSGGWDDYPPQVHVHRQEMAGSVTPVVTTAHVIRTAKILREAAHELGRSDDCHTYEADIARLGAALQRHAYDPDSGYYSYVRHNAEGVPEGMLRHDSGLNFNMGLDGASPLAAGICDGKQAERLLSYIEDPEHLWTDIGISTVDQSAPYYRVDGYWNGAVWFPHQWFMWKACLDYGRPDLAWRIASTALDTWNREVSRSYNCYEHFIIETGRGAGWHQFSGLSTPVLLWHGAYHSAGRLTFGFDAWLAGPVASTDCGCSTRVRTLTAASPDIGNVTGLYCSGGTSEFAVEFDGSAVSSRRITPQVTAFELPRGREGALTIRQRSAAT